LSRGAVRVPAGRCSARGPTGVSNRGDKRRTGQPSRFQGKWGADVGSQTRRGEWGAGGAGPWRRRGPKRCFGQFGFPPSPGRRIEGSVPERWVVSLRTAAVPGGRGVGGETGAVLGVQWTEKSLGVVLMSISWPGKRTGETCPSHESAGGGRPPLVEKEPASALCGVPPGGEHTFPDPNSLFCSLPGRRGEIRGTVLG